MSDQFEVAVPELPRRRSTLVGETMENSDEFVFVDNETGMNMALNTVAAAILEMCDGRHSAEEMVRTIAEATGGDAEQVASDVHEILQEFAAYGLFEG